MAVASPSAPPPATSTDDSFKVSSPLMEPSPSRFSTEVASDSSSSSPVVSFSADTPDRDDLSNYSPNSRKDVDTQSPSILKSEEYRQLFRLPPEEVLVEDFNCACQENILIQGHMYLFVHHICFYSNIFGFETKKIIPFHEVTSVRRAKTAGIFPNAIEIFAGGRKYFFASFLSRDEAFKIINDGWGRHSHDAKAITEQQESLSVSGSQENDVVIDQVDSFKHTIADMDTSDRFRDSPIPLGSKPPSPIVEVGCVSSTLLEQQDIVEEDVVPVINTEASSSRLSSIWKQENFDAPKIPEGFSKVAEAQFPIKVEDFFNYYFSDEAVNFNESFHQSCGDKEFKTSSWYPHEKFGHARDVSFQHPIKIYFGAKFGSCQETQKFRLYKNSHLVVETSQEISDVPYGDYFTVEALWDVERGADESKECCSLCLYVNVAFSKRTMWKGKIVQSTLEECREAYETWINMAQALLKKNLEKQEEATSLAAIVPNGKLNSEREAIGGESLEGAHQSSDCSRTQNTSDALVNQQVRNLFPGNLFDASSFVSWLRESIIRICSTLRSQGNLSLVIVVIFAVIFLMQLSILALLARPQHIHVYSPPDYMVNLGNEAGRSSEEVVWLEKRIHHLKDDMHMVEARLERMRHEHALLKTQLQDFKLSTKRR